MSYPCCEVVVLCPSKDDDIGVQRGEVVCPKLWDESVAEQEIKPRSPGSTDTAQLCNHHTTCHSTANIARLVALPSLRLLFASA